MALGRKMNNRLRTLGQQEFSHHLAIADIALQKLVMMVRSHRSQIRGIARISQLVEIDNARGFICQPLQDEIRSDESCSAGDQNWVCHAPMNSRRELLSGILRNFV